MTTTVVGVFSSEAAAQTAVSQLRDTGVPMDNISVIARPSGDIVNEQGEVVNVDDEGHMTAGEGLTIGAVWGGLIGLASLAIPGVGPVVASNIFAAALTGAVAGAATGGIAGALIDAANVPEEHARVYEDRVRAGGTLVSAQVDDNLADQARSILQSSGAEQFNWDDPSTFSARTDSNMNRLDEAGFVGSGMTGSSGSSSSNADAYDESSKLGTVGGTAAGALAGAAIGSAGGPVGAAVGGLAGAGTGAAIGAAGDTAGEHAEDSMQGSTSGSGYSGSSTSSVDSSYSGSSSSGYVDAGSSSGGVTGAVGDALTDDQGQDTIRAADQAYDDSSKVGTGGGALAGAATGAAIGSAGGPAGTAVGAVAGAISGAAAGAIGDTIGEQADENTGAFSPENRAQYDNAADSAGNSLRDAGNSVERGTSSDLDNDGDVGRRH